MPCTSTASSLLVIKLLQENLDLDHLHAHVFSINVSIVTPYYKLYEIMDVATMTSPIGVWTSS